MGYRGTMITEDIGMELPQWFTEKWKHLYNFYEFPRRTDLTGKGFPISTKHEIKWGMGAESEFFLDIAKLIRDDATPFGDYWRATGLKAIILYEDGYIDGVIILADRVLVHRSLKYDPDDDYNPQMGNSEEYIIPEKDLQ